MNNLHTNNNEKISEFIFYRPSSTPKDLLIKLGSNDFSDTEKLGLINNFRRHELSLKLNQHRHL